MNTQNDKVRGDTGSMPDRGHSTGVSDTYGADLSGDACNCQGDIGRDSKSDSMFETDAKDPQIGRK